MSSNLVTIAYIFAAGLFILSLSGLSHPETARRGNLFGMLGMLIALLATAAAAISAPTTITEEMALVTLISGVCSAGVTDQTT